MKANDYKILIRAIEEGIYYGWKKAHKHTGAPGEKVIKDEIENAVVNEICLVFNFDEDVDNGVDERGKDE